MKTLCNKFCEKYLKTYDRLTATLVMTGVFTVAPALPALAAGGEETAGSITDMLGIFSQLFAWILEEGATLLSWMLNKPILMISMGLFFCGSIIAFLMRIYHSV